MNIQQSEKSDKENDEDGKEEESLLDLKDNDRDSKNVNRNYLSNKELYVNHIFSHRDKRPYIEMPDGVSMLI